MKIANIAKEFLYIFRTTCGNSTKFSGKICFKIILKVTRKQGFWFNSVADNLSVSFKLFVLQRFVYECFPCEFQLSNLYNWPKPWNCCHFSRMVAIISSKNLKRTYFLNRYHKEKSLPAACRITKFGTSHKL